MQITIHEMEKAFYLEISPDTVKDAACLVRMALNVKRVPATISVSAYRNQSIGSYIIFNKKVESFTNIKG